MSYCRWSSDDWTCDVYVYEGSCGFVIHVAGNRVCGDIPRTPELTTDPASIEAYVAAHQAQMKFLETCQRQPIGLPFAGESLSAESAGECADELEKLRTLGYNVPQYAIDNLREEQAQAVE